jgi:hypothetical protein
MQQWSSIMRFLYQMSAVVVSIFLVAGCGGGGVSGTSPVRGKVTYNGEAVEGATISFYSEAEGVRPAVAVSASDGTYELKTLDTAGAMPGKYVVLVAKTETPPELMKEVSMDEAAANAGKPLPQPKELLPPKYGDAAQTPFKVEVKSGANTIDLALVD